MYRIIQSSPPRTGSTVLINLLHGFLKPNEPIHWDTHKCIHKFIITKTHETDIDKLSNMFGRQYNLYFVMSERNDEHVKALLNARPNVLVIGYDELNETPELSLDHIIL